MAQNNMLTVQMLLLPITVNDNIIKIHYLKRREITEHLVLEPLETSCGSLEPKWEQSEVK